MDDPDGARLSFEEFKQHINEAEDEGCSICFSLAHYKHLNDATLKLAWLGYTDQKEEYYRYLADELERVAEQPVDDNIYFLVCGAELLDLNDYALRDRILVQVLRRAEEMVSKDMEAAWVAVRVFGWAKDTDWLMLASFLEQTNDKDVWKVVFQCLENYDIPFSWKTQTLSLSAIKRMVRKTLDKLLEQDITDNSVSIPEQVVWGNGIVAMASLQDPQVLEYVDKLPNRIWTRLKKLYSEQLDRQIAYLTKKEDTAFVPILEQLKNK
jgi:hypothetical protein